MVTRHSLDTFPRANFPRALVKFSVMTHSTPLVRFHLILLSLVSVPKKAILSALLMSHDEASLHLLADRAIGEDSDEELLPTFTREPLENEWPRFVVAGE